VPGSADEAGAEAEYRTLLLSIAYGMTGIAEHVFQEGYVDRSQAAGSAA
jgi:hypothetical protein